ncbi:Pleckstrin homology domain-containing family B member 2 [Lamellibrachia satsuma]|nr:Pleckstrin homology domain-containing family B member 2 [Lamellibrachia satsuma]
MMAFEIAKAGFLYRQSSVLKRWKRSHSVLYQDGYVRHFEGENRPVAEEVAHIRDCLSIHTGSDVTGVVAPPSGCSQDCLLKIIFHDKTWILCAETTDDKKAWQISLEQAHGLFHPAAMTTPPSQAQTYPGPTYRVAYPGQGYSRGQPPPYVVQNPNGQTTVIYPEQRNVNGTDATMALCAGAAVGTLMWGPLLWW